MGAENRSLIISLNLPSRPLPYYALMLCCALRAPLFYEIAYIISLVTIKQKDQDKKTAFQRRTLTRSQKYVGERKKIFAALFHITASQSAVCCRIETREISSLLAGATANYKCIHVTIFNIGDPAFRTRYFCRLNFPQMPKNAALPLLKR